MKKVYRVGKGFGKKDFETALNKHQPGDVLILDPGEYFIPKGYAHHGLHIKGKSENATDVILHGRITVNTGESTILSNVTIEGNVQSNAVRLYENCSFQATNVLINGKGGKFPSIYAPQCHLTLSGCEVNNLVEDGNGIYALDGTDFFIDRCNISYFYLKNSRGKIQSSQIQKILYLGEGSEVVSDELYLVNPLEDLAMIYVLDKSFLRSGYLAFPEEENAVKVDKGQVQVDETNLDEDHQVLVYQNQIDVVSLPGAKIKIVGQKQTTSGSKKEETPKEEKPAEKPETTETATPTAKQVPKKEETATPKKETTALEKIHKMIGLKAVKKDVDKFITMSKFNKERLDRGMKARGFSLHSAFLGNPGTGKTTVARLVAKAMYEEHVLASDNYVEVSRQDLVADYVGGTAIKTKEALDKALGGVLFIDEAYTLYQEGSGTNWGQEAVDTILKYMEDHRGELMIIFAGYTKEMQDFIEMNPGLKSRIANEFMFEDYTPEEISEIGILDLKSNDFRVDENYYKEIAGKLYSQELDKSNGRWIRNLNDKLIQIVASNQIQQENPQLDLVLNEDLDELIGGNQGAKEQEVENLLAELDGMIGLKHVKAFVHGMIGLKHVKAFVHDLVKRAAVQKQFEAELPTSQKPTYHMVFTGAPGTGKTTIARLIAKIFYNLGILTKDSVSEVARPDLVGRYIGETEQKTSKVLRNAMGGVLFVDEAYQLSAGFDNDFGKQAIETLITELENNRDKFIAIFAGYTKDMNQFLATNEGLKSRIPLTIEFDSYTPEEVAEIVCAIVKKEWEVNEDLLKQVVTQGYKKLPENERSNGRYARNFADDLINQHILWIGQNPEIENKRLIQDELLLTLMGEDKETSKEDEVEKLLAELDGMIGLKNVKDFVHDLVQRAAIQKKFAKELPASQKPTYHMVFTGAPGTGKTTVARLIAKIFYNLDILTKDTVSEVARPDLVGQYYHMVFTGAPGTGKTTVARLIAKIFYNLDILTKDTVSEVARPDLVGQYIGETEQKTSKVLRDAMGGVLFVDEAYQLSAGSGNDFGKQAIETLITELENNRDKFIAIFAGYTNDMKHFLATNEGLKSRIPLTIEFDSYEPKEVAEIVYAIISKEWEVNELLLKTIVTNIYEKLPAAERSNGRYARNFADNLINQHILWIGKNPETENKRLIHDELLLNLLTK